MFLAPPQARFFGGHSFRVLRDFVASLSVSVFIYLSVVSRFRVPHPALEQNLQQSEQTPERRAEPRS